jgi:hypothetical protein
VGARRGSSSSLGHEIGPGLLGRHHLGRLFGMARFRFRSVPLASHTTCASDSHLDTKRALEERDPRDAINTFAMVSPFSLSLSMLAGQPFQSEIKTF